MNYQKKQHAFYENNILEKDMKHSNYMENLALRIGSLEQKFGKVINFLFFN